MTRVKLIIDYNIDSLQEEINRFIEGKAEVFVTTSMCREADGAMSYLATVCYKN